MVKNLPAVQETQVQYLGWEHPLEKGMAPTPVFLPGEFHGQRSLVGLQSMGSQRVGPNRATKHFDFILCAQFELRQGRSSALALKMVAISKVGICFLYSTHFLWGRIPMSAMKVRKPLVTAYLFIDRHQLNLERSPMNTVCVEKPSEGILTWLLRGITQARNAMNVKNVGKHLVILPSLGSTCDHTLVRKPINVLSVGRLSVAPPLSGHMHEFILERNCVSVASVGRSSVLPRVLPVAKRMHAREKLYECSDCGKAFIRSSDRTVHRRVHTGEKRRQWSDCGKTSSRKFFLMAHMRTHTGEKPCPVSACRKAFHRSSKATAHRGYMQEGRCSSARSFPVIIHHVGNTRGCALKTGLRVEAEKGSSIPQESNSVNSFGMGGSLLGLKLLHKEIQGGRKNI